MNDPSGLLQLPTSRWAKTEREHVLKGGLMPPRLKAYPWSDTKGLCTILRDPSIWGPMFPKSGDRQAVKSAAKRTPAIQNLPHVKVFNVTDDDVSSKVIIELLASPTGRKELDKEFSKRFKGLKFKKSLAERLYYHHLAQYEGRIPRLEEVCEKRTDKGWYFVPAKLKAWLARREISAEDQRTLSFYACYLALREPEQAEAILKVFINHDAAFLNWLSDGEVPSKSPTAALPTDSAELVQLLTSSSDWDRELPINQLRSAIYLLTRKAERHANRLHDFDETRY